MTAILSDPTVKDFFASLAAGDLNLITGLIWLIVAAILSVVGGAIGGIILAGKDLGYQLAATIGGLFGPAGVIPAAIVGLIVLKFV